jgi:hypothetical protein
MVMMMMMMMVMMMMMMMMMMVINVLKPILPKLNLLFLFDGRFHISGPASLTDSFLWAHHGIKEHCGLGVFPSKDSGNTFDNRGHLMSVMLGMVYTNKFAGMNCFGIAPSTDE